MAIKLVNTVYRGRNTGKLNSAMDDLINKFTETKYPSPVINPRATKNKEIIEGENVASISRNTSYIENGNNEKRQHRIQPTAGALPDNATILSDAARGLLLRLLERDPKVRMRNLRQLQQSAFYMGFNFENVKTKKVSPKAVLKEHFLKRNEESANELQLATRNLFLSF